MKTGKPPVFLDILRIQMPVMAITSILHRISGILMFLSLPILTVLFALSLQDAAGFNTAKEFFSHALVRLLMLLLLWSVVHHLLAGLRFLLTDVDLGIHKDLARKTAWLVNLAAPLLLVIFLSVVCL